MERAKHIGSNPSGLLGLFAGLIMNIIHKRTYRKIIGKIEKENKIKNIKILDVGCGGGIALKIFGEQFKDAQIKGIDHSKEMVELSSKINRKNTRIEITQSKIENIPYQNQEFDLITAFDTINLWEDVDKSVNEIKRVLKKDGYFIIVNAFPEEGSKWFEIVKFKTEEEYKKYLEEKDFKVSKTEVEKKIIFVKANNQE